MILGPLAEKGVRRTLLISCGDATELLTRFISAIFAIATLLEIIWSIAQVMGRRRDAREA